MTNSKWTAALRVCDELEKLLDSAVPVADAGRLARIQRATGSLKAGGDPYISHKAGMIESRAAIYLSARRHQAAPGGAEGVMFEMRYSLLGGIREQAEMLQKGEQ